MTTTNINGRTRKSLADQIDRLDGILSGLSDGMNEAVAEAVRAALVEVLSGPLTEVVQQAARADPTAAVAEARPGIWGRMWSCVCSAADRVRGAAVTAATWAWNRVFAGSTGAIRAAVRSVYARARSTAILTAAMALQAWRVRRDCGLALLAGAGAALGCYVAGPLVAALTCGAAGAVMALAVLFLVPVVRTARLFDPSQL